MPNEQLTIHDAAVARQEPTALQIISEASRDPQVNVEKLGALLAMKERLDAREAEMAFNRAMAAIAPKMPRVKKNGSIDLGRGKPITFARYEDIDEVVRPILVEEGLSMSFTSKPTTGGVLMTCTLSHVLGHSKSSEMQMPADAGPGRNGLQAIGSARSYAKRYLACDMLNIVTEGADDDARAVGFVSDRQADAIMDLLVECGAQTDPTVQSAFLKYMGAKIVSEIHAADFQKAVKALEAKRRNLK